MRIGSSCVIWKVVRALDRKVDGASSGNGGRQNPCGMVEALVAGRDGAKSQNAGVGMAAAGQPRAASFHEPPALRSARTAGASRKDGRLGVPAVRAYCGSLPAKTRPAPHTGRNGHPVVRRLVPGRHPTLRGESALPIAA